jgi:hypothetical protein
MNAILLAIPGGERFLTIQELAKQGLNPNMHKLFKYAKIKGNTLVFAFIHPVALQEFNLKQEDIKANMRTYWKNNTDKLKRLNISFQKIHAMVINYKEEIKEQKVEYNYTYEEKATGNFINVCADKKLHNLFEIIKEVIKQERSKSDETAH